MYAGLVLFVFLAAGTIALPYFWAVLGIQFLFVILSLVILDRDLIQERIKPAGQDQDPSAPKLLSIFYMLHLLLAALDCGRLHLSDNVPPLVQLGALIVYALAWVGIFWAMKVNKFFSSAIRIQEDRGQQVIDKGPYGIIRHPGYSAALFIFISEGIALGSWISVIPAVLIIGKLVQRTLMEEKMLHESLPGYTDYTTRVRYRWIPGVW
jgi:Putative protein-S-isoprenylcysteine methyltransferase